MKKKRVMIREKLIIGDKLKRYTFFTYYDRDNTYRITQCIANTIEDAEQKFVDLINLPYIKTAGKKEWHLSIENNWWKPLKVNKYKDIWAVDFIIRNNFIMSFVKISDIPDVSCKKLCLFTFALGCIEGGPFIIQCEASSLEKAISIWIKRISYQKYLSKDFRIYLKTNISKKYNVTELSEMKKAYKIDWEGCESTLFVIKDSLSDHGVGSTDHL